MSDSDEKKKKKNLCKRVVKVNAGRKVRQKDFHSGDKRVISRIKRLTVRSLFPYTRSLEIGAQCIRRPLMKT